MEVFIYFLLGVAFTLCIFNGKIKVEIKHIMEDNRELPSQDEMDEAFKKLNDPDTELDKVYEDMGETLSVLDVMKGSDRIDEERK